MANNKGSKNDMNMKIFLVVAFLVTFLAGYFIARAKYKPQIGILTNMVNDASKQLEKFKENTNKVMMKDDKMWFIDRGVVKPLESDLMMSSGDKVMMDGNILKSDGTTIMMKNGEAMDMYGNIESAEEK